MAGDFNKPSGSSLRTAFMTEIRDMFADLAKMFSDTSTTNYPTGAIRYNGSTKRREKYNGSTWDVLDVTGEAVGVSANTASATVRRDASGNFAAGVITGSITGNADTVDTYHAASLLARANHTGTQDGSTITGIVPNANTLDGQDGTYYRAASGGYTQAGTGGETLRKLRGTIRGSDGAILQGSGFTCTRTGAGSYRINFNTAFSGVPSASTALDAVGFCRFDITNTTAALAYFNTYGTDGLGADRNFSFVLEGPA